MMYILSTLNVIKNELNEFIFQNYNKRIGFTKENSYHSVKN